MFHSYTFLFFHKNLLTVLKTYQHRKIIDFQVFKEVIHRMWITSFHLFLGLFLISYQQKQAIPT